MFGLFVLLGNSFGSCGNQRAPSGRWVGDVVFSLGNYFLSGLQLNSTCVSPWVNILSTVKSVHCQELSIQSKHTNIQK